MLNALRLGLTTAALIGFTCSSEALAQSASSGSKSTNPPTDSTSPLNSDLQQHRETPRAAATSELRSMLLHAESEAVNEQLRDSLAKVRTIDAQLTDFHLSMESYPEIVKMLQSSRVELSIDLAGLEARQKELLKQRDSASPPNQQPLLAKELSIAQELVKISQEEFGFLEAKYKAGQAIATDVLAAKKELKLAELRLALAESKSSESSNSHSPELSKLILDRAEKSARLAVVEKLLESTYKAKPLVTSLNDAREQITVLQSLARRLSSDLREAKLEKEVNQYLLEHSDQPSVEK
jgi:hypothetical protein